MSPDRLRLLGLSAAVCWPLGPAAAQAIQAAAPAASAAELTPAERARRDGDKVFHWILIHADKPRKAAPLKDDKTATRAKPPVRASALPEEPAASAPPPAAATVAAPPAEEPATELLVPLAQPEPRFPANLLRTVRSGQVQVRFTVRPDGSVAEPVVVASSNPRLNPSTLAAVAQWRFAPVHKPQQGIVDLVFNSAE